MRPPRPVARSLIGRRACAWLLGLALAAITPAAWAEPAAPDPAASPAAAASPASVPADALPEPATPSAALKRGLAAFEYGQYHAAAALLRPLVEEERLRGADLVQALRAYGVALFLLGRRGGAEAAFLMLLRRDPRARLDPALVPPEAIAFLDEVRARHGADVARALRRDEPSPWLNLLPPLGQFQNRHQAKAVTLLILEAALLTLDVSTYWVLRQMPRKDGTVASESAFNSLKSLNIVAFSLLAGTVIYGIVDGFYYYRLRAEARERLQARLVPVPLPGGAAVALGAAF